MIRGEITVPADKSITHRAVLFGSIAEGETVVTTSLVGRDNLATMRIMRQLGVTIHCWLNPETLALAREEGFTDIEPSEDSLNRIKIRGTGFQGLHQSNEALQCGNSGTTARLLCGLLSRTNFSSTLIGDASLSRRPFRRVMEPLSKMGARFSREQMPFEVHGGALSGIRYESPVASAQIKSAILIAGLGTAEPVTVVEPARTRDHTERMFAPMGCVCAEAPLPDGRWQVSLPPSNQRSLKALGKIEVPGDFSSAAFFLVLGSLIDGSEIVIRNVGVNPTRTGLAAVLRRMGARIVFENNRVVGGEDVADIRIVSSPLKGVEVTHEDVVLAIDEIPALAVAAACANGKTVISGAAELRVKESDRLSMIASLLTSYGVRVEEAPDGLTIYGLGSGSGRLQEPRMDFSNTPDWTRCGDHRILMCGALLRFVQSEKIELFDRPAVETSFPNFVACLERLSGKKSI